MRRTKKPAPTAPPTKMTVESVDPEEGFLLSGSGSCFLVGRVDGVSGADVVDCRYGRSLGTESVLLIAGYLVGGWEVVTAILRCRYLICGYFVTMNK